MQANHLTNHLIHLSIKRLNMQSRHCAPYAYIYAWVILFFYWYGAHFTRTYIVYWWCRTFDPASKVSHANPRKEIRIQWYETHKGSAVKDKQATSVSARICIIYVFIFHFYRHTEWETCCPANVDLPRGNERRTTRRIALLRLFLAAPRHDHICMVSRVGCCDSCGAVFFLFFQFAI